SSGWTLAQSFPALQNSIFARLAFAPSPTLSLSSSEPTATQTQPPAQDQSSSQSQPATPDQPAMFLDGTLDAQSPLASFSFLLGNTQPVINGIVGMVSDIPDIPILALYGPISESV